MDSIIKNLIRVGIVSSVDAAACTVRVAFSDKENMVSYDLPVLQNNTLNNKSYHLPDAGEQVVCLFLPNGLAQGFVIGSIYSAQDVPPVNSADKWHVKFADGTTIEYDREEHTLAIDAKGPITIKAAGNITVEGDVIADGISLKTHVHGGVISGGGNTSGPH